MKKLLAVVVIGIGLWFVAGPALLWVVGAVADTAWKLVAFGIFSVLFWKSASFRAFFFGLLKVALIIATFGLVAGALTRGKDDDAAAIALMLD